MSKTRHNISVQPTVRLLRSRAAAELKRYAALRTSSCAFSALSVGRAPRQWLSIFFVVYSLIYPLLILAAGYQWPRMPASGVPCPTTLFTIGLVLAMEPGRFRVLLTIIPLLWTLVGGSAALMLGVAPDWALLLGALALAAYGIAPKLLAGRAA